MTWFTARNNRTFGTILLLGFVLILLGCTTANTLPTFEEARAETHIEMRKIVTQVPSSAFQVLVDELPNSSFTCGRNASTYTGLWTVYVNQNFNIQEWFAVLRSKLVTQGYQENVVTPATNRSVAFWTPGKLLISITERRNGDEEQQLDISGYSRCAQERIPTTPAKVPPITLSPSP
ncbi:MAG: hypothetical protein B5766_11375 [Candidatus Lumbricidophila eiseniae]|uniref:Lipoprotein n=1 Tax=Candidatus Lumbricidiphila eiseniae TaxID=1969409 RepID=A0A2A6FNE7_9MICO|nr:MAG: hypothetical protein B5766_11375 [Candidatus Lumbricidophila eiseniae]